MSRQRCPGTKEVSVLARHTAASKLKGNFYLPISTFVINKWDCSCIHMQGTHNQAPTSALIIQTPSNDSALWC